jgi:hypothetical protein
MRPIGLEDILGRERYGGTRETIRRRLIEHKRLRRVAVGDRVSLVFEDRATVWYQTQEMLWVEHITDLDAIRAELDIYNATLPGADELAATLFIELDDQARMRQEFQRLLGLDAHLHLAVGDWSVRAVFEDGRQTEEKISAVQYVRFPIDAAARALLASAAPIAVVIDHPNYAVRAPLAEPARASIAADCLDPSVGDEALRRVRDGG